MKQKWIAVLMAAVFMLLTAMGCAKEEQAGAENPDAYRNRFEAAAVSRQLDSVEGVTSERILETEGDVLISVDYPVVTGAPDISAEMKTFAEGKLADFRTAAEAASAEHKNETSSLMVTYKPYRTEGGLLSIKFTTESKLAGQETAEEIDAFVYDTAANKKLGLTDVFDAAQDYLTPIAQEAQAYLQNNEVLRKTVNEDQIAKGAAPSEEKYADFALAPDKVLFFFNRGTIAPAEAGSFEVGIPLAKLAGVLNEENKEAVLGAEQASAVQAAQGAVPAGPAETDIQQIRTRDGFMTAKSIEGIDPMNDKVIAITFDDGPHETLTPKLLDILKENGVVATFFMLGQNAEKYPDIVKRAYDEGHEIGTHSWDHRDSWPNLSMGERLDQYTKANDAIQAATGLRTLIDRPPYGAMTEEMAAQIGREQIIWSVDPEDWKYRDADEVYDRVVDGTDSGGYVQDGGIILSHDIHATTVEAFARIIPRLKDEGYTFVTVTQLMQIAEARGQDMEKYKFFSAPAAASASKNED
ncbi:polysaccharide deacetylase family protein [Christensenella tenuis]|uniref:Polysaccharide deacetylase family protein n=1 Tax=Christensenella tenuis TaxID=2763033 RepID=A0ABR7EFZ3_9FIRM|nr:polysaccharide deacetylase family protein [Christensenella tenuis]MBC5648687.1 polysaccharide deacetylase family protein [Christensenella tenuis]